MSALPCHIKTCLQKVGEYLQEHPEQVLAAFQELAAAAAIPTGSSSTKSAPPMSTATTSIAKGSIGRSQSKAQSSTEIPDFDYLGMVPSGAVPLAKAKFGERFVSRKVARGLWVQQKITIMGILADVEPNEKGFCMRCKAEGKPECLVLNRDSRINDLVFMSASCTTCIGAGQSCSSGIGDIDRQCYHQ